MKFKKIYLGVIFLLGIILLSLLGGTIIEGFTSNNYNGNKGVEAKTINTNQGNSYGVATGPQGNYYTGSNINGNKSYDNYNHYTGASHPVLFYGPDGGTARIIQTGNGNSIVITYKNGNTETYYLNSNDDNNNTNVEIYYGPNGSTATIFTDSSGKESIKLTSSDGSIIIFTEDNTYVYNSQDSSLNEPNSYDSNSYYGPNGVQATSVSGSNGNSATVASGPNGNSAVYASSSNGNTYSGTNYDYSSDNSNDSSSANNSSSYYNSLPPGISSNQIPTGQEDLYILKSQVVPPVCPKCPEPIVQCPNNFDESKCPPCPPCARCPEPAFDCKKVPNYNSFNSNYLPVPVLNDFSTFGM